MQQHRDQLEKSLSELNEVCNNFAYYDRILDESITDLATQMEIENPDELNSLGLVGLMQNLVKKEGTNVALSLFQRMLKEKNEEIDKLKESIPSEDTEMVARRLFNLMVESKNLTICDREDRIFELTEQLSSCQFNLTESNEAYQSLVNSMVGIADKLKINRDDDNPWRLAHLIGSHCEKLQLNTSVDLNTAIAYLNQIEESLGVKRTTYPYLVNAVKELKYSHDAAIAELDAIKQIKVPPSLLEYHKLGHADSKTPLAENIEAIVNGAVNKIASLKAPNPMPTPNALSDFQFRQVQELIKEAIAGYVNPYAATSSELSESVTPPPNVIIDKENRWDRWGGH